MNILHLEDSVNDATLVQDLVLEEWPQARIRRIERHAEFVAALECGGFDLILSDYDLPDFDGLTALAVAHRQCPDIPYIFLSGAIGEERAIEALQRGAADYVFKDRPARLVPSMRQALARAEETVRRQRAEQALRENQQRFQQLAEHSNEIFWFAAVDPEQILYVSPAVERIWGRPAADFYQDPRLWVAAVHPDDRPRVEAAYAAWVTGRVGVFEQEYRVVRPDDSFSWLLDSGTLIRGRDGAVYRASGIAKDITARRLAEEQLREQAALLDKARDAIIAIDPDNRITYWNASAERLYRWSSAEVIGRNLLELDLDHLPARLAAARAQVLAIGEWRGDFNLRAKTGERLQIESTWSLVRDAAGDLRSILLIDTDVTEQKKMESQLLRADRMDNIGMLAGGVAHDLNNVLAPILMGAELLLMGARKTEDIKIIENIERSAQHGAGLVRQLLNFARGGEGERSLVQAASLIEDVRKLLAQSLPRTVDLHVDGSGATQSILADATQIKQVLLNLAINARDAMPQGGRIEIRATDITVEEGLARLHPGAEAGPHVRISVVDTGTGIPPHVLEKIFDPFFTTKGIGKGTGLGLSTVLGIVKGHGGFLHVESEVGRGTEFALFLPAIRQAPAAAARSALPFREVGQGEMILLVDDDALVLDTLRLVLERSGFRVVTAPDGASGLAEFDRQSGAIAAVITDIHMPGMSGHEFIAAVRSRRSQEPVLAISGLMDSKEQELAALCPPVQFLAKPIFSEELLAALRRLVAAAGESSSRSDAAL